MDRKKRVLTRFFECLFLILMIFGLIIVVKGLRESSVNTAGLSSGYPSPLDQDSSLTQENLAYQGYPPPGQTPENLIFTPVPEPMQPPPCKFEGGSQLEVDDSIFDEYSFSEPEIILASKNNITLVEWLPDNQRILITEDIRGENQQRIELLNPLTGDIQIFAERRFGNVLPVWLASLDAVVFPEINMLDATQIPPLFTRQLWISLGIPDQTSLVEDNLSNFDITVDAGGQQIAYLSNEQLVLKDFLKDTTFRIKFAPSRWEYSKKPPQYIFPSSNYKMAWRPGSSQIAVYNKNYFFMVDTLNGDVCEFDLGGWAENARWSKDGQFLAIVRTWGDLPLKSSDLAVLDTKTGKLFTTTVVDVKGQHFVSDLAWQYDNYFLIVSGDYSPDFTSDNRIGGLYWVNFISKKVINLFPNYDFNINLGETGILLSPDGNLLLADCPTGYEERLCLVHVYRNAMP